MKVGIITMHRVLNFGSALQAYALQQKIIDLGYGCEIIDYDFPPKHHKDKCFRNHLRKIYAFLRAMIMGFPNKKKVKRFNNFYEKHYKLSSKKYTKDSIKENPPQYDVYITGSDQVWNPKHIGSDTNFLLSFVPKGRHKISYASSFATSSIPESYKSQYENYLKEYDLISVRESSGVKLVKDLCAKDAQVCVDPVFLLSRDKWDQIAEESTVSCKEKYILVYALYYMFDPYPELMNIINHVQKILGYKVVYLNGRKEDAFRPNSKVLKSEGPADFVQLIKNAEIVITTSFHGVAFSLIYNKPLMAIVRNNDTDDNRITSLMQCVGRNHSLFQYDIDCKLSREELLSLKDTNHRIHEIINSSMEFLKHSLMNVKS